jgi:hypothetical protein
MPSGRNDSQMEAAQRTRPGHRKSRESRRRDFRPLGRESGEVMPSDVVIPVEQKPSIGSQRSAACCVKSTMSVNTTLAYNRSMSGAVRPDQEFLGLVDYPLGDVALGKQDLVGSRQLDIFGAGGLDKVRPTRGGT